jgi:hypothetical protein
VIDLICSYSSPTQVLCHKNDPVNFLCPFTTPLNHFTPLNKKFKETLGWFRRNVPFGQMIEPKGKGGLISTSNYISFF